MHLLPSKLCSACGLWAGGIQNGLEGRAGVLGTHCIFFLLRLSYVIHWYAVAPHRADPGAFAPVDQSGQERQGVGCAFAIV